MNINATPITLKVGGGETGGDRGACLDNFYFYFIISIFLLWGGPTRGGEDLFFFFIKKLLVGVARERRGNSHWKTSS